MLDIFAKLGSALGIPIFIFTVIIPVCKNAQKKKEEKEKHINKYVIDKINELDKGYYSFDYDDNLFARTSMLKTLERVLKVKEVRLYRANQEDKRIIDLCFSNLENGNDALVGPLNVRCDDLGLIITLFDINFKKDEYKKYALKHINSLLTLMGK